MKNSKLKIDKVCAWVSNMFGVGYTPVCPGTAACVVAIGVFLLVKDQTAFLIITIVSTILSFAIAGRAEKYYGEKDPKKIVIDDFSGMLITMVFIPQDIRFIICGFFLFRMLDVLKIPPAAQIEKYHGALGIVGDDVIAGAYALGMLHLVRIFLGISI